MKHILKMRNTWHPLGLKKCVKIATILLSLFLSTTGKSETVNTGNILTNSTFGSGTTYDTTGWTIDEHTHGHNNMAAGGGNNPGGSVAAEQDTVISQTVSLANDTNMITEEIQSGWSSTLSADLWFWNDYENTVTLKQTITGSDGTTSVNQRIIEDTGCGYTNCGQFVNYSDTYIQGVNTQTDFDIKVDVTNTNTLTGHWGADIDDIELSVSYTKFDPITEDIQDSFEDIDNIYFDYEEIDFSIPEDIWTDFEDVFIEEEFFEEEFETIFLEEFNDFEEFEEAAFEELEVPEEFESFFSEEFTDEEMEIIEEEFADEFTDEIMDEVVEDEPTEFATTEEEEIIEEAANEEKEVASKEEETEEEIIEEKDNEQIAEEETETEILKEDKEIEVVETEDKKINIEVNDNVSVVVKEISLFDDGNQLAAYDNTDFYQPETIYSDVDNALFIQADLSIYNKGIYLNIGLDNYISTDPVGQHEQKLYEIKVNKIQLMIELQKLKELL